MSREGVLETLQHLNRFTADGVDYRSFTESASCDIFRDAVIAIVVTVWKAMSRRGLRNQRAGNLRPNTSRGVSCPRPAIPPSKGKNGLVSDSACRRYQTE